MEITLLSDVGVSVGWNHALYRAYGHGGDLLWVGATYSFTERIGQHSKRAAWWPLVERVTYRLYPNRARVLDAERQAILDEAPRFNCYRFQPRNPALTEEQLRQYEWGV